MPGERRQQIRVAVRYLRVLRVLAQGTAADHAAWARFVGTASLGLRAAPATTTVGDRLLAARYAGAFAERRRRLGQCHAPAPCASAHDAALGWLEALDRLAGAAARALARGAADELDAVVREGGEASRQLSRFRAELAGAIAGVRALAKSRPALPRPSRGGGLAAPHAALVGAARASR